MILLNILWMMILIINAEASEDSDPTHIFYPCKGTKKIEETFSKSNPSEYNLTISSTDIVEFPTRLKIKIKFSSEINATLRFEWLSYFDDGLSIDFITDLSKKEDLVITVVPLKGKRSLVKSVIINSIEICTELEDTDGWNMDIDKTSTTSTPNIIYETTTDVDVDDKCGRKFVKPQGFIVSGYESRPGDWPWHVALYKSNVNQQKYICGGTLISNICVITAGHCVIEHGGVVLAQRLTAVLGKYNFFGDNANLQEKKVEKIVLHPEFSPFSLSNDLSILILGTEVVFNHFVQPICLQIKHPRSARSIVGTMGYVAGWGIIKNGKHPNKLAEAQLPIVSKLDCIRNHKTFIKSLYSETDYCAGFGNGTSVCNGDSGGGMFIERNNAWYLQGIVSYGVEKLNERKCDPNYYTVFTDATSYTDFITENM